MTRRLIVNCDDLGADLNRNLGIFKALREGIATSASVLANGKSAVGLSSLPPEPTFSLGLHLNLTEGYSLAKGHRTLSRPDGWLLGKDEGRRRIVAGEVTAVEIEREIEAQVTRSSPAIGRLKRPFHLDGHHHAHILGVVPDVIARCARDFGIDAVRVPLDARTLPELAEAARRARKVFEAAGLKMADHFRGADNMWNPTEERLHAILRELPEGTTELMVHPGLAETDRGLPFGLFSTRDREVELAALTSAATRAVIFAEGIELITYREL